MKFILVVARQHLFPGLSPQGFLPLDAGFAGKAQHMHDIEARVPHLSDPAADLHIVAIAARPLERRPGRDQRAARDAVLGKHPLLRPAGRLVEKRGRMVEIREEVRVEDYSRRIAVAPFDPPPHRVFQQRQPPFSADAPLLIVRTGKVEQRTARSDQGHWC